MELSYPFMRNLNYVLTGFCVGKKDCDECAPYFAFTYGELKEVMLTLAAQVTLFDDKESQKPLENACVHATGCTDAGNEIVVRFTGEKKRRAGNRLYFDVTFAFTEKAIALQNVYTTDVRQQSRKQSRYEAPKFLLETRTFCD